MNSWTKGSFDTCQNNERPVAKELDRYRSFLLHLPRGATRPGLEVVRFVPDDFGARGLLLLGSRPYCNPALTLCHVPVQRSEIAFRDMFDAAAHHAVTLVVVHDAPADPQTDP
jgi:hypothetical protein